MLDRDEMCVALHLVYRALENDPVPVALPYSMVPPAKRKTSQAGIMNAGSVLPLSRKSTLTGGQIKVTYSDNSRSFYKFSAYYLHSLSIGKTTKSKKKIAQSSRIFVMCDLYENDE